MTELNLPIRRCVNCNKLLTNFRYAARNAFDPRETICPECMFTIIQDLQARTRSLPIPSYHMNEMADYKIWAVYQEIEEYEESSILYGLVIANSGEQAINTIDMKYASISKDHMYAEEIEPVLFVKGEEKEYSEVKPSAIIGCLKKENII